MEEKFKDLAEYRQHIREKNKLWYLKNREKKLQYQRDYYYNKKKSKQQVIAQKVEQ